jgi:hypothetical protein
MTIKKLQRNVASIIQNIDEIVMEAAIKQEKFIVASNRSQMWDGKNINNENIRPSYSEDPYFKKPGAAQRYAEWKYKITPNSKRDKDTPNLYITGPFYRSIELVKNKGFLQLTTKTSLGQKIISKFSNVLGLISDNKSELSKLSLPDLQKNIKYELLKN